MLNNCQFIGNTTKKPELAKTESGVNYTLFTIACNERGYKRKDGTEVPDRVEFVNCVAWRHTAEFVTQYVGKGQLVYVVGKFRTRSYEAQDRSTRYITEIVCEDVKILGAKRETAPAPVEPEASAPAGETPLPPLPTQEDLPF